MNSSNSDGIQMTSDEMIERSTTWTLACDNALLNRLRSISDNLEQNSEEITRGCESLSRDVNVLQAKLFNVTNQFLMVSNSQFVENRVQEFEEGSSNSITSSAGGLKKSNPKTKAEKEADLIAKMKDSIQIGVSTQEEQLKSLSLDQEHASYNICLPHLIGSSKFFSSRYVGLADDNPRVPSRATDNLETNPVLSSSIDVTEQNQAKSHIPPDLHNHKPTQILNPTNSEGDVAADLKFPYLNPNLQSTISKPESDTSVIIQPASTSKPQTNRPSASDDLSRFENSVGPPPPRYTDLSDESDDDFKPSTAGGGRLFADDDEDDLFNDSSLFVSKPDDNIFFGIKNATANQNQPSTLIEPPPYEGVRDKSRASNPSEGSNVGRLPENDNISAPSPLPVHPKDSHFPNEGATQRTNHHTEIPSKSKIPPGGVSVFGKVPPGEITRLKNPQTSQSKIYEEGSIVPDVIARNQNAVVVNPSERNSSIETKDNHDTSSHSSLTSKGMTSSQGSLNEPNTSTRSSKSVSGLFDDDSDEDIFSTKKKQSVAKNIKTNSTLFDQKNSSSKQFAPSDLPKTIAQSNSGLPKLKSKVKSSIFDDSESEDDLFSSVSSTTSSKTKTKKQQNNLFSKPSSINSTGKNKKTSLSMFGDDSDADLFTNETSVDSKSSKTNARTHDMNQEGKSNVEPSEKAMMKSSIEEDTNIIQIASEKVVDDEPSSQLVDSATDLHKDSDDNDANCDSASKPESFSAIESSNAIKSIDSELVPEPVCQTVDTIDSVKSKPQELPKTVNKKVMGKAEIFEKKSLPKDVVDSSKMDSSQIKTDEKSKPIKPSLLIKTKVSVKALASGLNINPLAMRPGAKAPKLGSLEKSDSVVSSETETPSGAATPESPIKTINLIEAVANSSSRISPDKAEPSQLLSNLSKGRAKIQVKRRPPSKQLLKSYVVAKEKEMQNYEDEMQKAEQSEDELVPIKNSDSEPVAESNSSSNVVSELVSPSTEEDDIFPTTDKNNVPEESCSKHEPEQLENKQPVSNNPQPESLFEKEDSVEKAPLTQDVISKKTNSLWDESDSDDIFAASSGKKNKLSKNTKDDVFSTVPNTSVTKDFKAENSTARTEKEQISKTKKTPKDKGSDKVAGSSTSNDTTKYSNSKSQSIVKSEDQESESSEIFEPQQVDVPKIATTANDRNNKQGGKSLFSDDEEDIDSIFSAPPKLPSTITNSDSNIKQQDKKLDKSSGAKPSKPSSSAKKEKGLFDSESGDSDDLFSSSSKPKTNSQAKVNDLNKGNSNSSAIAKPKKAVLKKKKAATTNSIFSDSSDDDLFASSKSTNKKSAVA